MNIIFFAKYYYPHLGGVEKHAQEVAERLEKKGHKITVVTMKHDKKLPTNQTKGGVKILRIPYSNKKTCIWKTLWQYKDLIKKADLIHCHDVFFWCLPFRFVFIKKPIFTTFHGWEGKYPIPFKNKLVRKISERLSKGNICVGDYIQKYYGTKPDYVTYGGTPLFAHGRTQIVGKKTNQIIVIGRLEEDLGINEYLKALRQLKKKYQITFVGDGSYRKQAEKIGKVTGMVKNIKPYLKKHALIFTSSYLTILEAMSIGRPVFALYQNQLKKDYLKLFPGAKYLNISNSAIGLVSQVETNLQGQTLKVEKGQEFAKKQTWDKVVNLYLKLWQT